MLDSPWFPFIYQYTIGGIVFIFGLLIAIKKKVLILSYESDRKTLYQLILGYFFYFFIHSFFIIISGV